MSADEPTITSFDRVPTPEVAVSAPVISMATETTAKNEGIKPASPVNGGDRAGRSRNPRPASPSMIVPADHPGVDEEEAYPPDDARAISPQRTTEGAEEMGRDARLSVQKHARQAQQRLIEIAESIELIRQDHERLERQNQALQDYIGGLTRSMSKNDIGAASSKSKK
ncbi:hypothetical protein MMC13_005007 [Lambiella insularis]|nr:hypothetical protein [Lambiella insularis]